MADSTTGGDWKQKAAKLRNGKLENAHPEKAYEGGQQIGWAKLDNRDRPNGIACGGGTQVG